MPILSNHRDAPEQVMLRAAQQDPWVMYLIVRQDAVFSPSELLLAAAQATLRCSLLFQHTPTWQESFRAWAERSFRKVSLRAREPAWTKLAPLDAGTGQARGVDVVRALPPRLRSECGSQLRNLQVFNPDPATLAPDPDPAPPSPVAMSFALNPSAPMSLGKQVAQVAHAVLMCAWSPWADDPRYSASFAAWRDAGHPCQLLPSSSWAHLHEHADGVVVRDAGLTEVDPGTETVLATPPGYTLP